MAKFTVAQIDSLRYSGPAMREAVAEAEAELIAAECTSEAEARAFASHVDGIICTYFALGRSVIEACPSLKVIVRTGIGFDNVDLQAATDHGVVVCNVTDYCIDEVANHAFAMILALNRQLTVHTLAERAGEKAPLAQVGDLRGETLGLVAFGNVARAVAKRAQAFGLQVIAYDPYVDAKPAAALGVELTSLEELLARSDYVSVHSPLNEETRGLIGADELARMKPTAYLVTTCRGGVVVETALQDAIKAGAIAGAGVDVWDPEPLTAERPLLQFDNVIATPHSAYYSDVSFELLYRLSGEAAADVLRGYLPRSVVNPAVLERVKLGPHPGR